MKRTDFYYDLPKEFIAQYPLNERSSSRLLILYRQTASIEHKRFFDIVTYLSANDVLVLNKTKVIPARLFGEKKTGGMVEILLLNETEKGLWEALIRPSARVKKGTIISFGIDNFFCKILDDPDTQTRHFQFNIQKNFWDMLERCGTIPLPPYIKRNTKKQDATDYQTVFAQDKGAVAAPTAGLHFTTSLLEKIQKEGVEIVFITLHVNYGTFRPVTEDNIEDHKMHKEYYIIEDHVAETINNARKQGKRIIACGTTTVRALESAVNEKGEIEARREYTDIFIYPPYTFKIIDALITNFHFPESTLLMLVSAFAGRKRILKAYEVAKEEKYRFFSYGDAMFIM